MINWQASTVIVAQEEEEIATISETEAVVGGVAAFLGVLRPSSLLSMGLEL